MPNLPQIFAEPSVPAARAPRVNPEAFGSEFFRESSQVFGRIAETQQLLDVQNALDKRDELYQQHRLDMELNPQKYSSMAADEFIKDFHRQAAQDDQSVLQDTPFLSRRHAEVLFSRLQRHQFDQQFTDYRKLWIDHGRAQVVTSQNDLIDKISKSTTDEQRQYYTENLNALYDAAGASGLFKEEDVAKMKEDKNSKIEQNQATSLMLDKQGGGPGAVLNNIQQGMYPNMKPEIRNEIIANATRLHKQNEVQAEKDQKARQDGLYQTMYRLAQRGQLDPQQVQDALGDSAIRAEHAQHLYSLMGNPTFASVPGAVNQIMHERNSQPLSIGGNNKAISQLQKLDGRDPRVTSALGALQSSNRALSHSAGQSLHITQAVREFKDAQYSGKQTVLQHFSLPGLSFQKQQTYNNAINHLEAEMGRGVPKDKAMREALDMVKPKMGEAPSAGKQVQDYLGE